MEEREANQRQMYDKLFFALEENGGLGKDSRGGVVPDHLQTPTG